MKRISQLMHIPGIGNSIYAISCLVILFFMLRTDIQLGIAFITIPVFLVGIAAPYAIRNWLVSIFPTSAKLLNGFLFLVVVFASVFSRKSQVTPTWLRVTLVALISVYLGCYFWLFSDERLQKE